MLFNSYVFLLAFFPLVVLGHLWLAKCPPSAQNIWLLSSSLFFYAWWDVRFIVLLLLSIFSNYIAAMLMDHFRDKNVIRNVMFVSIILVNLLIWDKLVSLSFPQFGEIGGNPGIDDGVVGGRSDGHRLLDEAVKQEATGL